MAVDLTELVNAAVPKWGLVDVNKQPTEDVYEVVPTLAIRLINPAIAPSVMALLAQVRGIRRDVAGDWIVDDNTRVQVAGRVLMFIYEHERRGEWISDDEGDRLANRDSIRIHSLCNELEKLIVRAEMLSGMIDGALNGRGDVPAIVPICPFPVDMDNPGAETNAKAAAWMQERPGVTA